RHTRFSRDWSSDVSSSDLIAFVIIEPLPCNLCPLILRHGRESPAIELCYQSRRIVPIRGQGRVSHVTCDPGQAVTLDHGTDVVQNNGPYRSRPRRGQCHRNQPTARGADDGRFLEAEQDDEILNVEHLDGARVVAPIAVVLRAPPATVSEGIDVARRLASR